LRKELEFAIAVNYSWFEPLPPISSTKIFEREGFSMPEVGETAPDFELPSHLEKGKKVKLSDFRGKSSVVLAFYPLAWTPV
jgi:AhpC/TSA family protein